MRVLNLVHQYLPEYVGGVELYTQSLAHELVRRDWEVGVFYRSYCAANTLTVSSESASSESASSESGGDRGSVVTFAAADGALAPTPRFLATWRQPALHAHWLAVLEQFPPDLVHVQHLMGLPTSLLDVLRARRIPYIVTLHDYWWQCANANLLTNYDATPCDGPQAYLNCTRCAVARAGSTATWGAAPLLWGLLADRNRRLHPLLARAAALLTPSEFVRRWYAAHGAPARHLQAVRLGVTPPPQPVVRRKSPDAGVNLLYLGGLAPNKGVHVVLEALRGVTGAIRLSIAGDETANPAYVSTLRHLADARVAFLGRLTRAEIWRALAAADAVVVPSLWHETFCFAAHEALTAGAPVLASAMGALTDAIRDGVDGLLLAPGDVEVWRAALQSLVDAPVRLATLRAGIVAPRQLAEHVDQIEAIYHEILAGAA